MRGPALALLSLALLLFGAMAVACGGSSRATINQPDCCGSGTSQPTASPPSAGIGDAGLYLALGDSLSFGIGASDANTTGFVALVHAGLGPQYELLNLGVLGDTSQDLIDHGNLDRAAQEITQRKADGDPSNDVRLVTLEIGGNDLLHLYGAFVQTGICASAQTTLANTQCSEALRAALDTFRPNLATTLDRLRAADPSLRILLLTLYNPFDDVPGVSELSDMSLEGKAGSPFPKGLNDIMRDVAQGRDDVTVVDIYPRFHGRASQLVAGDHIHPNDAGYRIMGDAVIAALKQ